jgi:hypothetical protein
MSEVEVARLTKERDDLARDVEDLRSQLGHIKSYDDLKAPNHVSDRTILLRLNEMMGWLVDTKCRTYERQYIVRLEKDVTRITEERDEWKRKYEHRHMDIEIAAAYECGVKSRDVEIGELKAQVATLRREDK